MPNQRQKGKKLVNMWLTEAEREALKAVAEREGVTMTEVIRQAIVEKTKGASHAGNDRTDR